jgi:flagellar basal body rod protein FlgB
MLFGFFGRVSSAPQMREALDASSQRVKGIAQRVSAATVASQSGFALPDGTPTGEAGEPVNLEAEMTSLADETLRYETTAKLLEKTYTKLRLAIRDR